MKLNELTYVEGSRIERFRKGRGVASGNGKTCGKGTKGQNSRTSGGVRPGFEGGQTPIYRRLPKRGFKNALRTEYAIINLEVLNVFKNGEIVDMTKLVAAGLVKKEYDGLKVLGGGELKKKLTVKANKFSKTASKAIEDLGGSIEVL
ncbi:MAG: 50S ribosomal protein L15 [Bacilli bacterium]